MRLESCLLNQNGALLFRVCTLGSKIPSEILLICDISMHGQSQKSCTIIQYFTNAAND